ncbi:hypothetical protein B0T25DRAFT_558812 [Lasiosphaeria hispida]|uniref:Telomerase reverse transcriptase n=1 Tax=Lasiosphaeria hispida TaxID=260671 RepID=A0AAJ0H6T6_9PEZI|nr:hypothetical protein B0T25DRAFT_558812 [Lasiosphaeria hispida]
MFNSLTVEFAKCPGQNFKRKVLNSFKIQSHLMFFDTSHNTRQSVLANAYTAFVETATKMWAYARCLPQAKRPGSGLLIDTVKALVEVAFLLLTSKSRKARYPGYDCTVRKTQLAWLAMVACRQVLVKKQSGYKEVISWLEQETHNLSSQNGLDCRGLVKVVKALPGVC